MQIKTYFAGSLGEYTDRIHNLKAVENVAFPPVFWFRAQPDICHSLVPTLLRGEVHVDRNEGNYSSLHYAEDIRTQHYIAKNYHFFSKEPSSRVEWLEVMQHHRMKTRALDWSESSMHALLFAIEPFLDANKSEEERVKCAPCVWVLEPGALNKKIFEYLVQGINQDEQWIKTLAEELLDGERDSDKVLPLKSMLDGIKRLLETSYNETKETAHLDYIFNLSEINDEILRDRSRLSYLLKNGNVMNPLYYFLSRIYSDGHVLANRDLPPLAVVHPYHSERIKAQKGVFTIFPFYQETENDKILREYGINPDAMEKNLLARSCLYKIVLENPEQIAYEMMENGMNSSWLYPELPIVSSEIEHRKVII